jgi:hypothetical protein
MEDEHEQAIRTLAAERYMLGQMTDAERETFEEHYFNCRFCVEDVKGIDLMSQAARQQPKPQPVPKWWRPMNVAPWAVSATLAGVLVLQPMMRTPPVAQLAEVAYDTHRPLTSESRAAAAAVMKLPAGRRILQYVEIAHDPQYTQYRWDLRSDEAKSLQSGTVTPEETKEPIALLLGPLPAGSYELVIEGVRKDGNRSAIIIQPLVVVGS